MAWKQKIRHFILQEKIPMPTVMYYILLGLFSKCKECYDGVMFPIYGTCPCGEKKTWPENYDDVDHGCGTYYCPDESCKFSKKNQHEKLYRFYNRT